jgi:hypothetical protein
VVHAVAIAVQVGATGIAIDGAGAAVRTVTNYLKSN